MRLQVQIPVVMVDFNSMKVMIEQFPAHIQYGCYCFFHYSRGRVNYPSLKILLICYFFSFYRYTVQIIRTLSLLENIFLYFIIAISILIIFNIVKAVVSGLQKNYTMHVTTIDNISAFIRALQVRFWILIRTCNPNILSGWRNPIISTFLYPKSMVFVYTFRAFPDNSE